VKKFIQSWLINTFAVLVAGYLVRGIHYEKPLDLFVAALVLGILNAVLRPMLMLLTFPLLLFTLGLFRFIINGFLLYMVGTLLEPHFRVDRFWDAFWGALVISLVSMILNVLTGTNRARIHVEPSRRASKTDPGGKGPIIDV
jgi:putative membrane protein